MTNPINWGNTPLANGAVRGFIAAIVTGLLYAVYELQKGVALEQAAMAGSVPMLLGFLALLGYGAVDQARANNGTVIPSDVPVQLEAKVDIAADHPNGYPVSRDAKTIAKSMTEDYQSRIVLRGRR